MSVPPTVSRPVSRPPTRRGARRRQFLPPQHGAWAMLLVPYLAGLVVAGFVWVDLPLLGAWLAGYLLSYYVFQAAKSRKVRRYRSQLLLYAVVAVPLAAVVVGFRPRVLVLAPAYAVLFAISAWYAYRRRERALGNDVVLVLQSCLLVFVVALIAGASPGTVAGAFAVCLLYFLGTVFHVKAMIRERDNPAFRRWSVGYHALALAVAAWLGPWVAALFGWLLVRAWVLPRRPMTPLRLGVVEIVNCLLLLGSVALTWA